ncbi:buaD, partial [Symbiodinium natans]
DIPAKLTLRTAEIPMEFGGFKIPQGATIFLYADAVHKDEKYFPDAAAFCPHRYTNPETFNQMNKEREIVTFGHGRKRCTGELHARSQISALLASFVMRFDMDLATDESDNRQWDPKGG